MAQIIDTRSTNYRAIRRNMHTGIYNGAYYYSQEIAQNIIPNVKTNRPWDTLALRACGSIDGALVFLHRNLNWDKSYAWLERYEDQIMVCSSKATYNWAVSKGKKAIFLPLSVDIKYVGQFIKPKIKQACYAGNRWPFKDKDLIRYIPSGVDYPDQNISREQLLRFIAPYKECYAIGRCAIEAQVLGCKIHKCDSRYEPSDFPVLDNLDAAKILQRKIDKIDK